MAQNDDQERTEAASPRRLEQAREEGQVARSQELTTFAMMMAAGGGMWFLGAGVFQQLRSLLERALRVDAQAAFDPSQMAVRFADQASEALWAVAPLLMVLMIVALVAPQLLSGWLLTSPRFDLQRLDPIAGFGRLFSMRGLVELAKALVKAALITAIAVAVLWHYRDAVQQLPALPFERGVARMGQIVGASFLILAGALALIAVVDVPFQLWKHGSDLKMSRQEVRQEMRESEGDPQMKAAIRNQQRAMARRRMMTEIPKASVIVTNPTHYAVALSYEDTAMRAPRVVAKGADLLAAKIREVGAEHHVPVLESPALARALFHNAEIGDEIPETLYTAVAEILAYVFQLRRYQEHGGVPQALPVIAVPPELDPNGGAR